GVSPHLWILRFEAVSASGAWRTCQVAPHMSAAGGKANISTPLAARLTRPMLRGLSNRHGGSDDATGSGKPRRSLAPSARALRSGEFQDGTVGNGLRGRIS